MFCLYVGVSPAFAQMRLDNTIQVLPAPPSHKINPRSAADEHIRLAPSGLTFLVLSVRRRSARFCDKSHACAFLSDYNLSAPRRFLPCESFACAKNYFHYYILIMRRMSSILPSILLKLYTLFIYVFSAKKRRGLCIFRVLIKTFQIPLTGKFCGVIICLR